MSMAQTDELKATAASSTAEVARDDGDPAPTASGPVSGPAPVSRREELSLAARLTAMKAAQRRAKSPSLEERLANLKKLETVILRNKDEFVRAIASDFGGRSKHETLGAEVFIVISGIKHAREHLADWMQPEERSVDITFFPGRAEVIPQPVGVVGIVAPWNYPMQLALGPLVGALAAGNRAIIKPSEFTPETGALLARILADTFASDHVFVVNGDADLGAEFTRLPFDHLIFTGSTRVGKMVMKAAAENLTPVTLELGGKSPTIIGDGFPLDVAAERIMYGKLLNSGQTCIAPDYVLVPKGKVDAFVAAAKKAVTKLWPTLAANPDYTAIVSPKHYERLKSVIADAKEKGAEAIELNPGNETFTDQAHKLVPTLLLGCNDGMVALEEELFGPILPIIPYDTLSDAIDYVNERPRPLALYFFEHDAVQVERVLNETISGGVSINETMLHIAQESLPFGGIGPSGMGHYHGREGFLTLSKLKPVFHQSRINATGLLRPPYNARTDFLLRVLIGG